MELIEQIIADTEAHLYEEAKQLAKEGLPAEKIEIRILGQMSLMTDGEAANKLPLVATADVDALLKGGWVGNRAFKESLRRHGLVLDDLSSEIWIPTNAEFIEYYNSDLLKISYLDPISCLTSKAIKAKEKNKILIRAALNVYGTELEKRIERHGGDLSYFKISTRFDQ